MATTSFRQISAYLPATLRERLQKLPERHLAAIEELRLKPDCPPLLRFDADEAFLCADGSLSADPAQGWILSPEEMRRTVLLLTDSSLYALEEELRRGYITLPGGHRAGLSGRAVLENGRIRTIKEISSVNLRIAGSFPGIAAPLLPALSDGEQKLYSTLIVSPPRAGKTTLLRDLIRTVSNGEGICPLRVGVADERSELAAMRQGIPQLPVGIRTDVLDGCPKSEALRLLLRSMGPELLVCDEIGSMQDGEALREAGKCGVRLLASVHGGSGEELLRRPLIAALLREEVFRRVILLSRREGPGTVEWIRDQRLCPC